MKKFKNIKTGIVEIVKNEKLIEQYEKHTETYVEVKEEKTLKELKAQADELGIEYNSKTTKAELLELLAE